MPRSTWSVRRKLLNMESSYGKQKARRIYGILENNLEIILKKLNGKSVTGENLLRLLELRLDNVVYRLGFANSRVEARQLVRHGHFTVNGRRVNIPSYLVRVGDQIAVKESSKKAPKFEEISELAAHKTVPAWLEMDKEALVGKVIALPEREDIDVPIQEHLIVELYSR